MVGSHSKILVFFYLIQDLDVLLPVLQRLHRLGADVTAFVAPDLVEKSPRVSQCLNRLELPWETSSPLSYMLGLQPKLDGVRALLTAADTSAPAHRPAYRLVRRAARAGIHTYTFQHGLENIGLTYFDEEFPPEDVDIPSRTIFIWGAVEALHRDALETIRRKCVAIGCPKDFDVRSLPDVELDHNGKQLVVVLENLHWSRYSDSYRNRFLADLEGAARAYPQATILVKPHHAGRWLTDRHEGGGLNLPNLVVADPKDPRWEPFTAPALIKIADAVVATPSTTVFDAACLGRPVAVLGYDLSLPVYDRLPIIRSFADWRSFIEATSSDVAKGEFLSSCRDFLDRSAVPGDAALRAAQHILNRLSCDVRKPQFSAGPTLP